MEVRRWAVVVGAVVPLLAGGSAGMASAAEPPQQGPQIRVVSDRTASPIHRVEVTNDGETYHNEPGVSVGFKILNCTAGEVDYVYTTLVQDGKTYYWASGPGLGAGELYCDGQPPKLTDRREYTGRGIHPGRARVTFLFYDDGQEYTASRMVTIPRRHR